MRPLTAGEEIIVWRARDCPVVPTVNPVEFVDGALPPDCRPDLQPVHPPGETHHDVRGEGAVCPGHDLHRRIGK